jgi:hypothetical protein
MKFWRKKTIYSWDCDNPGCDRVENLIMTDGSEPTIDIPYGWYAVLCHISPATSTFCSFACMKAYFGMKP